ncbi:unnamed protein product [Cylicocyclus nassatus]|uniref:Uncharacterized protein n=1 Tax=Cylicocyclus nassatus TaxID=53992 RepID=A0AA36GHL0_CYLNA|nr:unnamed protein product [Cylicocyclus nassatus]
MVKTVEEELEDYIWGRCKEKDYLERVVKCDEFTSNNILRRVSQIDESLNKQLRKGVEENLSRLLEQTTALEALDSTQRSVHSEMNEVYENCDRFAKTLDSLLNDYRQMVKQLEGYVAERNLTADAIRCEELMESLDKRHEIVKRSEIICEIKGIVADNPDLLKITWLRETLTTRLKAVENEVRRSAADDMRRGLISLNASLVASAIRALTNLGVLEAELEVQLSASATEIDAKIVELSSNPENSARLLPQYINHIHSQLEQCALLGKPQLMKFVEKLARIIRARVPLDAPFSLRFVQQMSRVLNSRPECSAPLFESLRPLKNSILSHSLARLHQIVEQHDFATVQNSVFVDMLVSAIQEEMKRLEWDMELRAEMQRNTQKCLDMVAKRLESEVKLDSENLLLGDRLRSDQLKNYRLLEIANNLAVKFPAQAKSLLSFEQDSVSHIMEAIHKSISTIITTMHRDMKGGKAVSPYMQELIAYIGRIAFHFSHFPATIRHTSALSSISDYIIHLFIVNATLVRPLTDSVREQLHNDLEKLLEELDSHLAPSLKYPRKDPLLSLFSTRISQNPDLISADALPAWIYIHALIAESPDALVSPHVSVEWTLEQYVKWCCDNPDLEIISFLNGLMTSYNASVINRHEVEYVPNYPLIMELIKKGTDASMR